MQRFRISTIEKGPKTIRSVLEKVKFPDMVDQNEPHFVRDLEVTECPIKQNPKSTSEDAFLEKIERKEKSDTIIRNRSGLN